MVNPINIIESEIVKVATKYLKTKEIPDNRGWYDKAFEKAMQKVGWRFGQHWCAYFMELVWKEAYNKYFDNKEQKYTTISTPTISGVFNNTEIDRKSTLNLLTKLCSGNSQKTFRNFQKSGIFKTGKEPRVGAAAVYKYGITTGHTVACVTEVTFNGFHSIEGNVSNKVICRSHLANEPNLLGFIYPVEF